MRTLTPIDSTHAPLTTRLGAKKPQAKEAELEGVSIKG